MRQQRSVRPVPPLYRATDSETTTMACLFWLEAVALAVSVPFEASKWSAVEQVLELPPPTLWSVPSVHPLFQTNDHEFPQIAPDSARPSEDTPTTTGSGLGVDALIELMLLANTGVVWSTFLTVAAAKCWADGAPPP